MWQCKNCSEDIEEFLTYCWKCATERFETPPKPEAKSDKVLAEQKPVESGKESIPKPEPKPAVPPPAPPAETKEFLKLVKQDDLKTEKAPKTHRELTSLKPPPVSQPEVKPHLEFAEQEAPPKANELIMIRYKDAYNTAHKTISLGKALKGSIYFIGGLILFIGVIAIMDYGYLGALGMVLGILLTMLIFHLGTLITAQGLVLKASVDKAVNSSPFLTQEEMRTILLHEKSISPKKH